jgi:hypothetical protein
LPSSAVTPGPYTVVAGYASTTITGSATLNVN